MMFFVIGIHTLSYLNIDSGTERIARDIIGSIAVPSFFFVDGLLFSTIFKRKKKFNYKTYVLKSFKRLIIPWSRECSIFCVSPVLLLAIISES